MKWNVTKESVLAITKELTLAERAASVGDFGIADWHLYQARKMGAPTDEVAARQERFHLEAVRRRAGGKPDRWERGSTGRQIVDFAPGIHGLVHIGPEGASRWWLYVDEQAIDGGRAASLEAAKLDAERAFRSWSNSEDEAAGSGGYFNGLDCGCGCGGKPGGCGMGGLGAGGRYNPFLEEAIRRKAAEKTEWKFRGSQLPEDPEWSSTIKEAWRVLLELKDRERALRLLDEAEASGAPPRVISSLRAQFTASDLSGLAGGKGRGVKIRDLVSELKAAGFRMVRQRATHQIWSNGQVSVTLPDRPGDDASPNVTRNVRAAIEGRKVLVPGVPGGR